MSYFARILSIPLPDVSELVEDEIKRKKYREDIKADFYLGRKNANQGQLLTQQEYRWRQVLLSKVKDSWIKGVLEKSLFNQVLFEQEITHKPDAVERPFSGFEEPVIESEQSFEFIQASDIFEGMGVGRTLLILGEPGTGKTLSMLKLAERLIKKAEQDLSLPIPVVFNLSSWVIKRQKIADWLVEELKEKYQVSKALGKQWIEQEALILLLDGLDEVKADYRNDCVKALNQFLDDHGITETVVCCRVQDYKVLSERLKLRNAICLQPLSSEYINWYLDDIGQPLLGLKQLLRRDKELEEFARTPLIFSVMSITYQDYSFERISQELRVKDNRYERLFDSYIKKMFARKQKNKKYKDKYVKKQLSWISKYLIISGQTLFFIENLQPYYLKKKTHKILYLLFIYLALLILALNYIDIGLMILKIVFNIVYTDSSLSIMKLLSAFIIFGLCFNSLSTKQSIKPIKRIHFSLQSFKTELVRNFLNYPNKYTFFIWILSILMILISCFLIISKNRESAFFFLVMGLIFIFSSGQIYGIFFAAFSSMIEPTTKIKNTKYPNQMIIESSLRGIELLTLGVFCMTMLILFIKLILTIYLGHSNVDSLDESYRLNIQSIITIIWGTGILFLYFAFSTFVQHLGLRIILVLTKNSPWNYANFLDYATERLFMQKVGGGYKFIHRMLMEHFANMKLD